MALPPAQTLTKQIILKDAARALSLANLCYIVTWTELLGAGRSFWPELPRLYSINAFLSVVLSVLALAALLFGTMLVVRRSRSRVGLKVARLAFPIMLLLPAYGVLWLLFPDSLAVLQLAFLVIGIAIIAVSDVAPFDRILIRGASAIVLILLPFVAYTFFGAFRSMSKFSNKPLVHPIVGQDKHHPRVIWLVFDELDQRTTFTARPASLTLPALDRLRAESFYASNAYPPADSTLMSMPALITGRLVTEVHPINPSELMITFDSGGRPVPISREPNVFSEARKAGANSAIVGNYFPYCRILENSLTDCRNHDIASATLRESMLSEAVNVINTIPLGANIASYFRVFNDPKGWELKERRQQLTAYQGILEDAKETALNQDLNLILVHWPVPHTPNIYNRAAKRFELENESSYLDNLQLCDEALSELRNSLESNGQWDDTIVLVTSDHWWRADIWRASPFWSAEDETLLSKEADHRIPFVLKLARQKHGVTYEPEFNTVLTHDLILALLNGELRDASEVAVWLDQHRSIGESPYRFYSEKK